MIKRVHDVRASSNFLKHYFLWRDKPIIGTLKRQAKILSHI